MPRCRHSWTSYFGSSSTYPTNSSEAVSLKSLIGKIELNTACRPVFSRFSGSTCVCRKRSKDCFWISIRLGISRIAGIFEKFLRIRGAFSENWFSVTAPTRPPTEVGGLQAARRSERTRRAEQTRLLDVDLAAGRLDLRLDLGRLVLGDALLDRLGRALDEILGLLEAEAGDGAHLLDDLDLLVARRHQNDVELGLLLDRRGGGAGGHRRHRDRCGGRDAPLVFQQLGELGGLHHREGRELVDDRVEISHDFCTSSSLCGRALAARPGLGSRAGHPAATRDQETAASSSFFWRAATSRASWPAGAASTPAIFVAGAWISPTNRARSASSE